MNLQFVTSLPNQDVPRQFPMALSPPEIIPWFIVSHYLSFFLSHSISPSRSGERETGEAL